MNDWKKSEPSKRYVTDECHQHGQPRPYADHEYVHIIIFTQDEWRLRPKEEKDQPRPIRPWYPDEPTALAYARLFCPFKDTPSHPYERILVSFERLEPTPHGNPTLGPLPPDHSDRWKIHVRAMFTD